MLKWWRVLTKSENLLLKAITSAKDRTGEVTSSLRYAFMANLNSASIAVISSFAMEFSESMLPISRWSITIAPSCLDWRKIKCHWHSFEIKIKCLMKEKKCFMKCHSETISAVKANNLNLAAEEALALAEEKLSRRILEEYTRTLKIKAAIHWERRRNLKTIVLS